MATMVMAVMAMAVVVKVALTVKAGVTTQSASSALIRPCLEGFRASGWLGVSGVGNRDFRRMDTDSGIPSRSLLGLGGSGGGGGGSGGSDDSNDSGTGPGQL